MRKAILAIGFLFLLLVLPGIHASAAESEQDDDWETDVNCIVEKPDEENLQRLYDTMPIGNIDKELQIPVLTFDENLQNSVTSRGTMSTGETVSLGEWGSITLYASFEWYEEGLFSYVRCTSMNAVYNHNTTFSNDVVITKWIIEKDSDFVRIGRAKVSLEYRLVNSKIPYQYKSGKITIYGWDDGSISM